MGGGSHARSRSQQQRAAKPKPELKPALEQAPSTVDAKQTLGRQKISRGMRASQPQTPKAIPIDLQAGPLSVEDCVRYALGSSATIEQEKAQVDVMQARLQRIEAVYYPKLTATAFIAPMFTVEGDATTADVTRRYKSIEDWGPYTKLKAQLVWPLYTFGRAENGKKAAGYAVQASQAKVREVENVLAREVRKLHAHHLFALGLQRSMDDAEELLGKAQKQAQDAYDGGTGEVSQTDLMRLRVVAQEVAKQKRNLVDLRAMTLSALKHAMGLAHNAPLQLKAKRLSRPPKALPGLHAAKSRPNSHAPKAESFVQKDAAEKVLTWDLVRLIRFGAEQRPEWAQLDAGEQATAALARSHALAWAPTLFVAGEFEAAWTPTRDDSPNPYHQDPYNLVRAGGALGFNLDLDWASSRAQGAEAKAQNKGLQALRRFAQTGIPLQIRNAFVERARFAELCRLGAIQVKAARKWRTFAAAAYASGSGEARDLLEGVASHLQSKAAYAQHVRDYHVSTAELLLAVGVR